MLLSMVMTTSVFAQQQSVVGSPHDLSATSGPGRVHALDEEQVCIFCHAPHNSTGQSPLWNRFMPPTHYKVYESSTTDARIDQPSGPSKMCLSCHDGALALGLLASRPPDDPVIMSTRTMPPGRSDLTTDLSDDHPISFRYDRALAVRDGQLKNPDVVTKQLPLGPHSEMQCTTCHDPHNNKLGDFLREPQLRSTICLSCHVMQGWRASVHANSIARVTGRAVDPREVLPFHTVAENACNNCHKVHSAEGHERLLRFSREQENCLNCHNGSVARNNIDSEIHKPSAHPVWLYPRRHDPREDPRVMPRHVQCPDCHNPHSVEADIVRTVDKPSFGEVDRTELNVSGIDRFGRPVERAHFEYEICFKCHADSLTRRRIPEVPRQVNQSDVRLQFQTSNPSFHPVVGPRNNPDVVSLIPPWRTGSVMRCTDCHNSDQAPRGLAVGGLTVAGGPAGPHGSIYDPILISNYTRADFTMESTRAYALCYRCHSRQSILANQSFPLHSLHIVDARAPCAACHDAHGISRAQGNATNHSNLINFDLAIVQPATGGLGARIQYQDQGQFRGSCTLTCHNVVHVNFTYGQ
jgi:predicted CXXCH cytochrome family protein